MVFKAMRESSPQTSRTAVRYAKVAESEMNQEAGGSLSLPFFLKLAVP